MATVCFGGAIVPTQAKAPLLHGSILLGVRGADWRPSVVDVRGASNHDSGFPQRICNSASSSGSGSGSGFGFDFGCSCSKQPATRRFGGAHSVFRTQIDGVQCSNLRCEKAVRNKGWKTTRIDLSGRQKAWRRRATLDGFCISQNRGTCRRGFRQRAIQAITPSSGGPGQDGLSVKESGPSVAISIRDLSVDVISERGNVPVLRGCSLNVPEGQFWMLLGPNGCGKSTLLRAMAGLLRPNWGHMFLQGPRSFVLQNPDYQVVMPTAEADVVFGLGRFDLAHEEVRRRVHQSLEAVGMVEFGQRPVQTLSGGQKQRIAIAGALAESSKLLLFDEITTYLDGDDQTSVLEVVRNVVGGSQAVTALWVTHRLEELEYADGAAYMEHGRVVLNGDVKEVKKYIQKQQRFQT